MNHLQRITTEFIGAEDRIRLSGQHSDGSTVVLWLTRRLLNRAVPHLTGWLQKGISQPAGLMDEDTMQSFAQQSAQAKLPSEAPVQAATAETGWLVESLDITSGSNGVKLTFKGEDTAVLVLVAQALRQWLGILFSQYQRGDWSLEAWPDWMHPDTKRQGDIAVH